MIRPDFREIKHSELYHYGVSKRNGAPGPGSGRYPLGSGKEPFQGIVGKRIQRNNYNYKTSDAYKNGSDETKKSLNNLHRSISRSVSGKSRNRVEYDIIEKGVDKTEALKKEIRSKRTKYMYIIGSNVLFFSTKYGLSLYKNLSAKMKLGNMVIDQYAYDKGLKYYESKIPTMGLRNIIIGDKLL